MQKDEEWAIKKLEGFIKYPDADLRDAMDLLIMGAREAVYWRIQWEDIKRKAYKRKSYVHPHTKAFQELESKINQMRKSVS